MFVLLLLFIIIITEFNRKLTIKRFCVIDHPHPRCDALGNICQHLNDVLSRSELIQCEANVSHVAPSDDSDSGAVCSDIQSLHDVDDEPRDVTPAFRVNRTGRVQHERHV